MFCRLQMSRPRDRFVRHDERSGQQDMALLKECGDSCVLMIYKHLTPHGVKSLRQKQICSSIFVICAQSVKLNKQLRLSYL